MWSLPIYPRDTHADTSSRAHICGVKSTFCKEAPEGKYGFLTMSSTQYDIDPWSKLNPLFIHSEDYAIDMKAIPEKGLFGINVVGQYQRSKYAVLIGSSVLLLETDPE